jgi:hypothetical protein
MAKGLWLQVRKQQDHSLSQCTTFYKTDMSGNVTLIPEVQKQP